MRWRWRSHPSTFLPLLFLVIAGLLIYFIQDNVKPLTLTSKKERTKENTSAVGPIMSSQVAKTAIKKNASPYRLPSYDKPFDEVFDELKLASEKGNAKATCRLAIELLRCQAVLAIDEKQVLRILNQPAPKGMPEELKRSYDEASLIDSQMYLSCKKMRQDDLLRSQDLLEKAAMQKQVDAMVLWASGTWIETRYGLSQGYLQDPAFQRWQISAIPTMNEALKLGSYGAALEWDIALSKDRGTLFYGLVKNDPKRAYTFSYLIKLLENSDGSIRTSTSLSASDSLMAEQSARQMFEKWFNGKASKKGYSSESYSLRRPEYEDCNL